jgi:hypothetical protein
MYPRITSIPAPQVDVAALSPEEHRDAAEQALETAQRNPVLSAEQACAVAQVHALLAIEHHLAQLCRDHDAPVRYATTNRP